MLNLLIDVRAVTSDPALEAFKLRVEDRIRQKFLSLDEVKDQKVTRAYHDFFWRVGIDPTKARPAGEALLRRIVSGKAFRLSTPG